LDDRLFAVLSVCDLIKASQAEAHITTGPPVLENTIPKFWNWFVRMGV